MSNPTPPLNPFVEEGDAEGTAQYIQSVIQFFKERAQHQIDTDAWKADPRSLPGNCNHLFGEVHILSGLQDAVKYLGDLAQEPKLREVKDVAQ